MLNEPELGEAGGSAVMMDPPPAALTAAPSAHKRKMIQSFQELPSYSLIHSARGGKLADVLTSADREEVAVVDFPASPPGDQICQVFCTPTYADAPHGYADLVSQLRKRGWTARPAVRVSKEIVLRLYEEVRSEEARVEAGDTDMDRLFMAIVRKAAVLKASDIHLERRKNVCSIGYRVDKRISIDRELNGATSVALMRAMFGSISLEDTRSAESFAENQAQSCAIAKFVDGAEFRIRYQHAPVSPSGTDCVLRMLPIGARDDDRPFAGFASLGYSAAQDSLLCEMFATPKGAMFIAGKMGSGKSTTLKHGLEYLVEQRPYMKVRTIEDPVEYFIKGVSQHGVVRRKTDQDRSGVAADAFAETFRAILRMDSDALMLGEIRDSVTAKLAMETGQAGQKIAATVHANSGFGILRRIMHLGISKEALADDQFLAGLIFQELLPVNCPHCRKSAADLAHLFGSTRPMSAEMRKWLESKKETLRRVLHYLSDHAHRIFFEGTGCEHCKGRRTVGMTVCAEVIAPDEDIRDLIGRGELIAALRHWEDRIGQEADSADGMRCVDHGMRKLMEGAVSAEAFEDTFGPVGPRRYGRTLTLLKQRPDIYIGGASRVARTGIDVR